MACRHCSRFSLHNAFTGLALSSVVHLISERFVPAKPSRRRLPGVISVIFGWPVRLGTTGLPDHPGASKLSVSGVVNLAQGTLEFPGMAEFDDPLILLCQGSGYSSFEVTLIEPLKTHFPTLVAHS